MRYIGNKENIIVRIHDLLIEEGVRGDRFFDLFAGTASVGRFYKQAGYEVGSCDIMYMSYCLQKAYIGNNAQPRFEALLNRLGRGRSRQLFASPLEEAVACLNDTEPVEGFIYKNYTPAGTSALEQPRMYFSSENGARIDAIRMRIEEWRGEGLLDESEYYILIACLLETVSLYANVAGVYAAFHKKWDPRAVKRLELRPVATFDNGRRNRVYNADSMDILGEIDTDILYLDPPYNQRQYFPNYHLLETIARYDNPQIKGVTGMRATDVKRSSFCNARTALADLARIAAETRYDYLVLSYNSEGIMPQEKIVETLSQYGDVRLRQFENTRFKSNNNGLARTKRVIDEQIYILTRR